MMRHTHATAFTAFLAFIPLGFWQLKKSSNPGLQSPPHYHPLFPAVPDHCCPFCVDLFHLPSSPSRCCRYSLGHMWGVVWACLKATKGPDWCGSGGWQKIR